MNLNFDFNGKTKLKDWWKIVKTNFETIKNVFNSHTTATELDHPEGSVKGKHIAEGEIKNKHLSQNSVTGVKIAQDSISTQHINDGAVTESKLSSVLRSLLLQFTKNDTDMQNQIANLKVQSSATDLYGTTLEDHTFQFMAAPEIPPLTLEGDEIYNGNYVSLNMDDASPVVKLDGKTYAFESSATPLQLDVNSTNYIVITADMEFESFWVSVSSEFKESTISGSQWTFTAYVYNDITLGFAVSSESPTGDLYSLERYNGEYASVNADDTGDTYTVEQVYSTSRDLGDLETDNKSSFLDAVNENATKIKTLETSGGTSITVDSELSFTSENPVQNRVVNEALSKKMDWECDYLGFNNMDEVIGAIVDLQERVSALEG